MSATPSGAFALTLGARAQMGETQLLWFRLARSAAEAGSGAVSLPHLTAGDRITWKATLGVRLGPPPDS